MRILYDHQVFSLQDAGGASRYHYELIRHLQQCEGIYAELLIGLNRSVMPFARLSQTHGKVLSWNTRMRPGKVRYAANELLSALVAPLRGVFDIYHPTLYRALPWVRRRRVVVTHHDCIHERFPSLFSNAASIVQTKRKLFAQADAIICVSKSSQDDLLHYYDIAKEKTHVVHHGFSALGLPAEKTYLPELRSGGPYLLYVGSRASYKNFSLLLEAFSRSGLAQTYRLVAVGGGEATAEEKERIASLGLAEGISIVPRADEGQLAHAYQRAALFVYPSLYEGFGFPPLEAMSMNCPVLVNRTSSLPEICGDAAFYFDATNSEELARSLISVLGDSQELSRKRRLGLQRVGLYDWQQSAKSTLAIYRELLET
jgi:glycosyltransferase involved in cell wall biosynthesis